MVITLNRYALQLTLVMAGLGLFVLWPSLPSAQGSIDPDTIVLYAADAPRRQGAFDVVQDASAAGGDALRNVDANQPLVAAPLANPASFTELTFTAEAGQPYHLWIHARAVENRTTGDSIWIRGEDKIVRARAASSEDAKAIARIYNEGIEERIATFETSPRAARKIQAWFDGTHPVVVVEEEGEVISFANTTAYSPRRCYSGVAEFSVYTTSEARGSGAGTLAMKTLIQAAKEAGFWKLVARVFVENEPSRKGSDSKKVSARWESTRNTPGSTEYGATL